MEGFHASARLRRSVPFSSFYYAPNTSLGSGFSRAADHIQFQQAPMQARFQISSVKNASRAFTLICSFPKGHSGGSLQLVIDEVSSKTNHITSSSRSSSEQIKSKKILVSRKKEHLLEDLDVGLCKEADNGSNSEKSTADISDREIQRRQKIGLANKGKAPWNKGRKHSEETRERIKKRTIEALKDPKVRKKMSECPRSHSDQSKARISSALRRVWEERLKRRRLQEKCYLMWAGSIAEAAREGAHDQQELNWDSYEKLKSDMMFQHLQWKAEKARAKEIARLRAETAAKVRAENAARLAQQRKEKEEKAKAREMKALARKKLEEEKKKIALSKGLKIKARLTKFHYHSMQSGSIVNFPRSMTTEPQPTINQLDMELIKIEKMQRKLSLADQIRAVKSRKAKFTPKGVLTNSINASSIEEKGGDS